MLLLLVAPHVQHAPAAVCPYAAAVAVDSGWRAYRSGALGPALTQFATAQALCPTEVEPVIGIGFVLLRQGRAGEAERLFQRAVAADSTAADGWYGLGLARGRLGRRREAVLALRRAVALAPDYIDAVDQLLAWGVDSGLAPPPVAPSAEPQVAARTQGEHFEVRTAQGWEPFYVKGINLGAALPGKFPSQFPPDDSTYARWLELIAAAHANTVRLYTILPPAFYRALRRWNEGHPDRALWLVHGVWAELPPGGNYDAPGWKAALGREMRRAVDVVHGRARVAARAGHAWGRYDADVSDHVLAWVLGREWEPFSIHAYNRRPHGRRSYPGRVLAVDRGPPADAWLAGQCGEPIEDRWGGYPPPRPLGPHH